MRPRSTANILYTDEEGFILAAEGRKICTSRYGTRTELKKGDIVEFTLNDGSEDNFLVEILHVEHKEVGEILPHEAWAISNYSLQDAYNNFREIYTSLGKTVDFNTPATLVWFKKL